MKPGETIGQLAEKKEISLRQLAIKADIPYNTLYAIVKRKSERIDLTTLGKIALALDTTVMQLVGPDYWSTVSKEEAEEAWGDSGVQAVTVPPQQRISAALGKLNGAGMEKAADAVEVIAEVPRYSKGGEEE